MNSYEHTSRELLPLSVIRSACAGDTDAVEQVLQHYRGYINKLCTAAKPVRLPRPPASAGRANQPKNR